MKALRLRQNTIWQDADGEVLAVDDASNRFVSTNAAGRVLWKALATGASREELAAALVGEFGIDADQASRDVDAFVAELARNGFLED